MFISVIGHTAYKMSKTSTSQIILLLFFFVASIGGSTGLAIEGGETFDMINEARTIARTGNYSEALDKLHEAIVLAYENEEKLALAIAHNNVAEIHRLQGNTIEALESYSQALQVYHEIGHRNGISSTGQKIDKILGRPKKTKTVATPETIQEPGTVQTPETVETTSPALPPTPRGEIPAEARGRLIDEAINRVRNRIKDRQALLGPSEPPATNVSEPIVTPPQEPLQQSAKLEPREDTRQTEYTAYLEKVKENIVQAWQYPEQASEKGSEGKVDVEFTILKDGRLLDVRILQSSGFSALDREAIRAVGAASPFTPIPKQIALEQLSIRFTFNYTLEKQQGSR